MKILPLFRLAMPLAALLVAAPIIRAQQFYDNNKWPSPNVVKLDDVPPALTPLAQGTGHDIRAFACKPKLIVEGEIMVVASPRQAGNQQASGL